ncbi:helix-turn-helix transcriptional regulator [Actinomadura rayongensis]|uniref:Helix-turn-helix domain-containing protein n=1 Tax=Actinomadura rayongensis TaxID=1429076 RepID=A0A6I4W7H5_9ACTN|nr:AraC family transcriptional regulator [Actinomadura rayongensis]MXQ66719.1 helix-turn-helix domain-containing protein [Actinomadura rayongensis]
MPSSAPPVELQLRAFADAHGVVADSAGAADWLAPLWRALRAAGIARPGLAFAAWAETAMLGGLVPPILANSPDVGALLAVLQRYHPLLGRNELVVERAGAGATLTLRSPDGGAADPDTVDACFGVMCHVLARLTGGAARPDRVRLRRSEPADPAAHRAAFGTVAFGQPRDACDLGPGALAARIRQADPVVLAMLEPYAEQRLAAARAPWSATIEPVMRRLSDGAPPRLPDVARALAVSPRTLQLRLRAEGLSYAALADAFRRDRALALLAATTLPVTAIAARLGFATPAAFTRAVRRWTGETPTAYRAGVTRGR